MTNIGSFGDAPVQAVEYEFAYFGETIRVNPELGELDYIEFLSVAGGVGVEDVASLGLVKGFAQMCIAPDDFERFWALARKNRQKVDQVFKVLQAIVEATVDLPTAQPSDSSAGLTNTDTSSLAVLPSQIQERLSGRPDLQLVVTKAQEAQAV